MRISSLLMVVLCGLVSVCAAGDAAGQSSSSRAAVNSLNADWLSPSAIARYDFVQVPVDDRLGRYSSRPDSARDGDKICYTIQSFLVKRERPRSDATAPVGYSTCVPASKYGVKVVGEQDKTPAR